MKTILFLLIFIHQPFHWEDHKLSWIDFEGVYDKSEASASSCTELYMDMNLDSIGGVVFNVKAIFHPESSFIAPFCSKSSRALKHEQLHFDITEVYARQLRILLAPLQHTHNQNSVQMSEYYYEFVSKQWNNTERDYDCETDHANKLVVQQMWEIRVANALIKPLKYANKSSPRLRKVRR